MKINARLEDISDGKFYDLNDMVKADTRGCEGCSACCHGMGDTIVLNPYDMYRITAHTGQTFHDLLDTGIALHTEEKITLPNLKMFGSTEACAFLGEDQRCTIHKARPGICRLFPLGRYYEDDNFKYIFKTGECIKPNLSKVKVKKWIDIPEYGNNKAFILAWHRLLKALKWRVKFVRDDQELQAINEELVNSFYMMTCENDKDFYEDFYRRLPEAKNRLGVL